MYSLKFKTVYYYMRNFCNLIGLEHWYFTLIVKITKSLLVVVKTNNNMICT